MEDFIRPVSSKSSILVHWEKTIAFSPVTLIKSFEPLTKSEPLKRGSDEFSGRVAPSSIDSDDQGRGVQSLGLESDCKTSRAALILEESKEWLQEPGSSLSDTSEPEQSRILSWAGCSEREHFNVSLENNEETLSWALQFVVGHWLSSPVRCSETHWLQKTCPQLVTTASSGGSYECNHMYISSYKYLANLLGSKFEKDSISNHNPLISDSMWNQTHVCWKQETV